MSGIYEQKRTKVERNRDFNFLPLNARSFLTGVLKNASQEKLNTECRMSNRFFFHFLLTNSYWVDKKLDVIYFHQKSFSVEKYKKIVLSD